MNRWCMTSVVMLLLLSACTHERGVTQPAVPAVPTPTTSGGLPDAGNTAPSSAPQGLRLDAPAAAVPPVNTSDTSPTLDAPVAATTPAAQSPAPAAPLSVPPRKTSQAQIASTAGAGKAIEPPSPPAPAAAARSSITAAPALDLRGLEERLRNTSAIGVFTKLSLKNQVDDLLAQFKALYSGASTVSLAELRQRFELLLMKVVTLLQDDDPALAAAVSSSRQAIWGVLSDPKKFASL